MILGKTAVGRSQSRTEYGDMTQVVTRQNVISEFHVSYRSVHVEFVVGNVGLEQVVLLVIWVSLVRINPSAP